MELFGLVVTLFLSYLCLRYYVEFGEFKFSNSVGKLSWKRRGIFHQKTGTVSYDNIAKIKREARQHSSSRLHYSYRLVVLTHDENTVPLTRGFMFQKRKTLEDMINRVRLYLPIE